MSKKIKKTSEDKSPSCAVLLIGNELLSGRTEDANLTHIARRMSELGIRLVEARVVPDIQRMIVETVNELRKNYTYVFTTGGIGPTHDDITTASIAEAFGVDISRDKGTAKILHEKYGEEITPSTLKMADFPQGAELVPNGATVAPGFRMENVFCFAGIPRIMRSMLDAVIPHLERGENFFSQSVDAFVSESSIGEALGRIQEGYPRLDIGSYPFRIGGRYGTSLVVRGTDSELVNNAFNEVKSLLDSLGAEINN